MPRPRANDTEQDKLARFERIKKAITALEKQQAVNQKVSSKGRTIRDTADITNEEY